MSKKKFFNVIDIFVISFLKRILQKQIFIGFTERAKCFFIIVNKTKDYPVFL